MNVYDFDKTIYDGDSTFDFYLYCLKKHPKISVCFFSLAIAYIKYYILGIGTKTQFKETMYSFLKYCDTKHDVERFWKLHKYKIKQWYLDQHKSDDLIISASPQFLLDPIAEDIGFSLIASVVSEKTGKYTGVNCYNDEKVRRLNLEYPNVKIDRFYSDSYADKPLADISNKAYIVDGNNITDWVRTKTKKVRK